MSRHTGKCLCGGVAYAFDTEISKATACHCSQCRRTSGHFWAAFHVPLDDFELTNQASLCWFESSDWAKRGFCNRCGSSLFYQLQGETSINIAPGTLDGPTGLTLTRHIFVGSKGDYYDLNDGLEQLDTY